MSKAYINHLVTDQGNGGAVCDNCRFDLTRIIEKWSEETLKAVEHGMKLLEIKVAGKKISEEEKFKHSDGYYICPNCKAELTDGGVSCSIGGSDF